MAYPIKVPNDSLMRAGLDLMRQSGRELEPVATKSRAMIFRTAAGETVRVRTCNDHVLVVLAETPALDAKLNIEGTDHLLIVMPAQPRTAGDVAAYLVPTDMAVDAVRTAHGKWLASNPSTKGLNRTWNIQFDDNGPDYSSGFMKKWEAYRLPGRATTDSDSTVKNMSDKLNGGTLGDVIASARRRIAEVAGVPETSVKITLDLT